MISDELAESLEKKGYWRRAAQRWWQVMNTAMDEDMRLAASQRQSFCIKKIVHRKEKRYQSCHFSLCVGDEILLRTET
jgi:Pyruvate/2-oxoacid:ferredoxin oxidoreductase delta subunit